MYAFVLYLSAVEVEKLIALSNFLVIFNSSVNFVIYCTCGERFRRLLIRLCRDFMWCRVKGKQGSNGFYRKSQYYRSQHGILTFCPSH